MTCFSLAEAARRLDIDVKTLHRWLAEAHCLLQSHPRDGRKKGISDQQLSLLASLHHRQVASLSQEPPISLPCEVPTLPDALLTLPEQLATLQAQIAALQLQVADLTHLLTQHVPASTRMVKPLPKPTGTVKPSPKPTPARPAAKTPTKPKHVIPRVEYGEQGHYVVICPKLGVLPFEPDTEAWFAWVREQDSFRFVGQSGYFTAHHEWRVPKGAWRAHRHIRNRVYIQRLAPHHELTIAVLEQAAQALQAHLS